MKQYRGHLFILMAAGLTATATVLIASTMILTRESLIPSFLWLTGFTFLFFNVSYLFLLSILRPFIKEPVLAEFHIDDRGGNLSFHQKTPKFTRKVRTRYIRRSFEMLKS